MSSNSYRSPRSLFNDFGELDPKASKEDLEGAVRELWEKAGKLELRLDQLMSQNTQLSGRITQLNLELETCRGNFQELNLLDGFLRSGAVRSLNLDTDPNLKHLLTSFLARALQTALDTKAVRFPQNRRSGE